MQSLVFTFVQEFLAAILLFFIFYPTNCYVKNDYAQIALHFVSVIVFDIITLGAGVNPAITIGLYTQGILSLKTTIASILGYLFTLIITYSHLHSLCCLLTRTYTRRNAWIQFTGEVLSLSAVRTNIRTPTHGEREHNSKWTG